ncbi:pyrroline-5-carboxylate reductase [Arcanobacterium hippocoleae]|uniref:Pyrroline-5-carboxylate reductase n=1 Tax=Arcanobacterium hippocoleae TaxID=149017 RepID=A0ABU1T2N1_9ACTO|nr:pyrroline-5-carboxylate reductase [Arcanobacterium hippocoleae]MDR6939120.1 pyrroline-5-carboxylate reductase [Arcanobacterium hippocoleae]
MLGFLGAGAMGSAILRGVLSAKAATAAEIRFTRVNDTAATALSAELGVQRAATNTALVSELGKAGIVILGVKPYLVHEILSEIAPAAAKNGTVIVSVAAGISLEKLSAALPANQPIVRAMPNVASAIGKGMTALCANDFVTAAQFAKIQEVFAAVGAVSVIAEKDFPAFSAIAGCSPAWTFAYIDALSRAALAAGMTKAESVRVAAQAVAGAAQLAFASLPEIRPQALIDTVTSPGGTTVAGLIEMEQAGFSNAVINGVRAAIARDAQLG